MFRLQLKAMIRHDKNAYVKITYIQHDNISLASQSCSVVLVVRAENRAMSTIHITMYSTQFSGITNYIIVFTGPANFFPPILSPINPVYVIRSHLFKVQFNITLPLTPRYSKWFRSFKFPTNTVYPFLLFPKLPTYRAPQPLRFDLPNIVWWEIYTCKSCGSSLCNFFQSPLNCSLSSPNIFLRNLTSNTLTLFYSRNVTGIMHNNGSVSFITHIY